MRMSSEAESYLLGYLAFLTLISIAAATGQWTLESLNLIGEDARIISPFLAGAMLVGIGMWHVAQPFRHHAPCGSGGKRRTVDFLQGWRHGCSSLRCCLTMIGVQFVGGAMNIGLMIGLTLWMMLEAAVPWKRQLSAATGIALLTAGGLTIMGAVG